MTKNNNKLDLHGFAIKDAVIKADQFIDHCFFNGHRDVQIITGNGPMFKRVLEVAREHSLVEQVKNDGPLSHLYRGVVAPELSLR